jgi:hypothetical protein
VVKEQVVRVLSGFMHLRIELHPTTSTEIPHQSRGNICTSQTTKAQTPLSLENHAYEYKKFKRSPESIPAYTSQFVHP